MPEPRTLSFSRESASFGVVPARGGIVSRFAVGGREILFMDAATLADPAKNVRGGIPVLFPSPGKLSGVPYAMNQHGFARELPWSVVTENPSSITLELTDTGATRALFPFEFRLAFSFSVEGASLAIRQRYENRSKEKMPFSGFDLTRPQVDLHLLDHGEARSVLTRPDGRGAVEIAASPEFRRWVVWTLAGKDFVCVEPWTAPANALNTGEGLLRVAPGEARELWVTLTAIS
jgi:galactose mutarotase-like enzyme